MHTPTALTTLQMPSPSTRLRATPDLKKTYALTENDRGETLRFLAVRPVHTVVMASFIEDNGVVSELNRGKFFGYRNADGHVEGIALIGHTTLVEARTDDALKALAFVARNAETPIHLIMSSGANAAEFHAYLTGGSAKPRLTCVETLFEARVPFNVQECEWNIRTADMCQLEQVAAAQAEIAFIESGVDPLLNDRDGFLSRVTRRIEQGRIFTVYEEGELIFKADIIAETADTIYLEGIYVHPSRRGKGVGPHCLAKLTADLLGRVNNVCMLSNVDFPEAHKSFEKAGFRQSGHCVTFFV